MTGEGLDRFLSWLNGYGILYDDYMKEASEGGRYVHSIMEKFITTGKFSPRKYKKICNYGREFLETSAFAVLEVEKYFCNKHYQGTIDIVAEKEGEKWILDWKTYSLAKSKFGIANGEYRKPYGKLQKAQLQLSLYARSQKATRIGIIELNTSGYYFYEMPIIPDEKINIMLKEFKFNYVDEI